MDYIPVYEGEDADGTTVRVAPGRIQATGVRSEPVARREVVRPVRERDSVAGAQRLVQRHVGHRQGGGIVVAVPPAQARL